MYLTIVIRENLLRKERKLGSNHTVKFSKVTWHHIKFRERKGPSRGILQSCEPHERSPCAPKFAKRTQDETLHQEHQARGVAWDLAKSVHKLKNKDKATLYSPIEAKETKEMIAAPAPTSKPSKGKIIRGGLRSINAHAGQQGLELR